RSARDVVHLLPAIDHAHDHGSLDARAVEVATEHLRVADGLGARQLIAGDPLHAARAELLREDVLAGAALALVRRDHERRDLLAVERDRLSGRILPGRPE